jgi:hypothetical protein
MEQVKEFKYLS